MPNKYGFVLIFALLLAAPVGLMWSAQTQQLSFAANSVAKTSNTVQYVNESETSQLNSILNTVVSLIQSIVTQLINLFSQAAKSK
jgi:hypothetical protein